MLWRFKGRGDKPATLFTSQGSRCHEVESVSAAVELHLNECMRLSD